MPKITERRRSYVKWRKAHKPEPPAAQIPEQIEKAREAARIALKKALEAGYKRLGDSVDIDWVDSSNHDESKPVAVVTNEEEVIKSDDKADSYDRHEESVSDYPESDKINNSFPPEQEEEVPKTVAELATKAITEGNVEKTEIDSTFSDVDVFTKLASRIEQAMFLMHNEIDGKYRSDFRRHLISLKDPNNDMLQKLLQNHITPEEFATLPLQDLMSPERRKSNNEIMQEAIRMAVITEVPSDIKAVQDGRSREKWGVERSAAAIDY